MSLPNSKWAFARVPCHVPRVIRVGFVMSVVCRIYTQHRTFPDPVGTSQLGRNGPTRRSVRFILGTAWLRQQPQASDACMAFVADHQAVVDGNAQRLPFVVGHAARTTGHLTRRRSHHRQPFEVAWANRNTIARRAMHKKCVCGLSPLRVPAARHEDHGRSAGHR